MTTSRKPRAITVRGTLKATPRRKPTASDPRWYWQVYYNHGGAQHKVGSVKSGRYQRGELRALLEDAWDRGDWHSHNKPKRMTPTTEKRTVGYLLALYEARCRTRHQQGKLSDNSLNTYIDRHARLKTSPIPGFLVAELNPATLQAAVDEYGEDRSAKTVAQDMSWLSAAWRWGQRTYPSVYRLAMPAVELPEDDGTYCTTTPSHADLLQVRGAMRIGWHRDFLTALMATGGRADEVNRWRWQEHIDLEGDRVLMEGKGKGRRGQLAKKAPRWVPMSTSLREVLAARRQDAGPVWPVSHPAKGFRRALRCATAAAGVERFTPHGVRRWVCTELMALVYGPEGFSPKDYEAWTGHQFAIGVKLYAQVRGEHLDNAARALEARLADNVVPLRSASDTPSVLRRDG